MFSASQQEEMNPRKCTHLLAIQSVFMATHRVYIQTISIFSTVFAMKLVRYNMKNFNRAPSAETLLGEFLVEGTLVATLHADSWGLVIRF